MPKIIDPKTTTRAMAYELWMKAPNPMVTFFKTVDVTNLVRVSIFVMVFITSSLTRRHMVHAS